MSVAAVLFLLPLLIFLAGCGAAKTAVPDVTGSSLVEAEKMLRASGLEPGEVVEGFSDTIPRGMIAASDPARDTRLKRGSRVRLTVSRGPERVEVPALLGRSEPEAVAVLQELGFSARLVRAYSEDVPQGHVCGIDPSPGTTADNGSTVTLTISEGSAYIACPRCGGSGSITSPSTCPRCGGSGTAIVHETCPECGGSGVCPT